MLGIAKGGTSLPTPLPRVRKHERIHHHINTYDDWYRLKTANGVFESADKAKRAEYSLTMGYDNLYNITSKKMTMSQTNLQFDGTLSAGHEFSYNYSSIMSTESWLTTKSTPNCRRTNALRTTSLTPTET